MGYYNEITSCFRRDLFRCSTKNISAACEHGDYGAMDDSFYDDMSHIFIDPDSGIDSFYRSTEPYEDWSRIALDNIQIHIKDDQPWSMRVTGYALFILDSIIPTNIDYYTPNGNDCYLRNYDRLIDAGYNLAKFWIYCSGEGDQILTVNVSNVNFVDHLSA